MDWIRPKFEVGQKVKTDFDDTFFKNDFGVVREINIKVSSVGVSINYQVADVEVTRKIIREFNLNEYDLESFDGGEK